MNHRHSLYASQFFVGSGGAPRLHIESELAFDRRVITKSQNRLLLRVDFHRPDDFESAFASMRKEHAAGVVILAEPTIASYVRRVAELAIKYRMPSIHTQNAYATTGGLMSYGTNSPEMYIRASDYVDKILKDALPGDLPIQQPTKFELFINGKTAKTLGIKIPNSLLVLTDKVIE